MTTVREPVEPDVRRTRTAVVVAFLTNGAAFASLASRTPAIRDALDLSTVGLGLLLLCLSIGAVTGLPLAGTFVHRVGPGPAALSGAVLVGTGFGGLAVALATGTLPLAQVSLAATGLGMGAWDVAMNVEGADVERRIGRSLMPRLHGAFSLGTVSGAGIGLACVAADLPLAAQLGAGAVLVPLVMVVATRRFTPVVVTASRERMPVIATWREPRTVLIGVLVLSFAFTEGAANDWIAIAVVDGYGASEATGSLAFGLFVGAMTAGRLLGGGLLRRFGRVPVLRFSAVLALAGLTVVLLGGSAQVALGGALLWGAGTALGFPVGMSAAADDPARAAARVSVVSSIAYTAFLAGPPLIGVLADGAGILRALVIVAGVLGVAVLASGASRPLDDGRRERRC